MAIAWPLSCAAPVMDDFTTSWNGSLLAIPPMNTMSAPCTAGAGGGGEARVAVLRNVDGSADHRLGQGRAALDEGRRNVEAKLPEDAELVGVDHGRRRHREPVIGDAQLGQRGVGLRQRGTGAHEP